MSAVLTALALLVTTQAGNPYLLLPHAPTARELEAKAAEAEVDRDAAKRKLEKVEADAQRMEERAKALDGAADGRGEQALFNAEKEKLEREDERRVQSIVMGPNGVDYRGAPPRDNEALARENLHAQAASLRRSAERKRADAENELRAAEEKAGAARHEAALEAVRAPGAALGLKPVGGPPALGLKPVTARTVKVVAGCPVKCDACAQATLASAEAAAVSRVPVTLEAGCAGTAELYEGAAVIARGVLEPGEPLTLGGTR